MSGDGGDTVFSIYDILVYLKGENRVRAWYKTKGEDDPALTELYKSLLVRVKTAYVKRDIPWNEVPLVEYVSITPPSPSSSSCP